ENKVRLYRDGANFPAQFAHDSPNGRFGACVPVFIPQPLVDAPGGMPLLAGGAAIFKKPLADNFPIGACSGRRSRTGKPVLPRARILQGFPYGLARMVELLGYFADRPVFPEI